jgi:hypothetical protein
LSVNLEEPLRMTTEERLNDLLENWLSLHQQGREVPAAELCRDCPELLAPLDERIAVMRKMNALVDESSYVSAGVAAAKAPFGNRQSGHARAGTRFNAPLLHRQQFEVVRAVRFAHVGR